MIGVLQPQNLAGASSGCEDPTVDKVVRRPRALLAHRFLLLDLLVALGVGFALAEHFKARAGYATTPYLGLILPLIFWAVSPDYRALSLVRIRRAWRGVEAYAAGASATPWLGALLFVSLPFWLFDLSNQLTNYPAGMVPFAVAVTGAASALHVNLDNKMTQRHLEKMTAALVASMALGLYFLVALRLAPARAAWVSSALLAVGSGLFTTVGMGLWQHAGIIFWSLLIVWIEVRSPHRALTAWDTVFQGFAAAQLVSCRLTSVTFLIPFGLWVLWRRPWRALVLGGASALAFLPWSWFYLRTYGSPFGPSTGFLSGSLWSADLVEPVAAVLFSPSRGLLVYQPWILVGLAWLWPGVRQRTKALGALPVPPGFGWFCLAAIAAQVLLISAWGCWWGGWCWGSRLVVDSVPFCGLLCLRPLAALLESRRGRATVLVLAWLSLMAHLPCAYFHAYRWNAAAQFPEDAWSVTHSPFSEWHLGP